MIQSILVVCIGNVCRSPMAEGLLRDRFPDKEVSSAGLGALVGHPTDPNAVALMAEHGIDITSHRARQMVAKSCRDADLIFVMDSEQKRAIEREYPFIRGRVFRLGHHGGFDIPDPYGEARDKFEISYQLISGGVAQWAERISALA